MDNIVEQLKARKSELESGLKQAKAQVASIEKELKQVNTALAAFGGSTAGGPRKPMSEEAKQKIRDAQLRRHQASNAAPTTE